MSPANETGASSTSLRASAPAGASTIKCTANSRGAALISENIGLVGVQVPKLCPYIQSDIWQAKQCKVNAMLQALLQRASCAPETIQPELLQKCLKAILPVCNGQVSAGDISSSGIKAALHEYVNPGRENNFYGSFTNATNIALACLADIKVDGMRDPVPAVDMVCQQNNRPTDRKHQMEKFMQQPDIVLIPLNSACSAFPAVTDVKQGKQPGEKKNSEKDTVMDDEKRKKRRKAHMDTNATGKPKNLSWKDILACLEFKRKTLGRTKGITSPPSSYTSTDYVPTEPEYLRVEHRKVEASTPDSSQTSTPQTSSDTAFQSSGLTTTKASLGGSSSKRKAAETLESVVKRPKMNSDNSDADIDVAVQTGLYAAEMFASNLGVNYLLNIIVVVQVEGKQCDKFEIEDKDLGTMDLLLHTSHEERVTHYGLQGRATNVVPVTSKVLAKKYPNIQDEMVAKIFWAEADCISEPKILDKVEEVAKEHESVKGHIPELLWHHTFTNPTSAVRSAVREALGVSEPTTGSRVLYILVFRKLRPITELHGQQLFDVWYQCILYGKLIGVLNDYDLSSLATELGPRGNECTGTVPFMALDLLTKAGVLRPRGSRPFDEWATSDAVACGNFKLALQSFRQVPKYTRESDPGWQFIRDCLFEEKAEKAGSDTLT
ncbi:hypothetical protein EDD22DRAFT_1051861 [Suillus occidentalis]|nr:hypothetical protein EDD22DRAFT_1051861 [Suillus occidentalis]